MFFAPMDLEAVGLDVHVLAILFLENKCGSNPYSNWQYCSTANQRFDLIAKQNECQDTEMVISITTTLGNTYNIDIRP